MADRDVTVKGLVERTVKSDLRIWTLRTRNAGDNLATLYEGLTSTQEAIKNFLVNAGF